MSVTSPNFDPMQPSFEVEGMPTPPAERFNPAQRRAFGSVPGLLGRGMDIPPFERLDATALDRVSPEGLRQGLLGPEGRNAVDGIVLNAEEYTAIVRSPRSFQSSVQAKTVAANREVNPVRGEEKELKSGVESFRNKWRRQNAVLKGLHQEREAVDILLEWQKVPGYSRTSQIDIVSLASQAYHGTIANMLRAYKDQHQLNPKEYADMQQALAYRLFKGPQTDKIANWGGVLQVAHSYTNAKISLFQTRQRRVERTGTRLAQDLKKFYTDNGITQ